MVLRHEPRRRALPLGVLDCRLTVDHGRAVAWVPGGARVVKSPGPGCGQRLGPGIARCIALGVLRPAGVPPARTLAERLFGRPR
jgi:hypothetical protein